MDSLSPKHAEGVCDDLMALVSERILPIDQISKVIVLSEGALWKHRMIRDPGITDQNPTSPPAISAAAIETRILSHILALHRVLLQVGIVELEAPPEDAAENDLAQRITATFRRTLPALRIAGKWLRANLRYVLESQGADAPLEKERYQRSERYSRMVRSIKMGERSTGVPRFWSTYAEFSSALLRAFPAERLPVMNAPLEEDIEMRGFLPLRKMVGEGRSSVEGKGLGHEGVAEDRNLIAAQTRDQVHPNVEQLMRIADLLDDANALVEMEVSGRYDDLSCNW